jgi:predicted nuclease with TOPRIM domain
MNLNKLEIKRQSLELKFANICKQIDELEYKKFELEEIATQVAILSGSDDYQFNSKYNNKMFKIDDKIYKLEEKQGEVQDRIDSIMLKLNITY